MTEELLGRIDRLAGVARHGDAIDQDWIDTASSNLQQSHPELADEEEAFALLDDRGEPNGLVAPRWFCHLIGLRHGTVHVALWTSEAAPRCVVQVRSSTRKDFPRHYDLSVTGHAGEETDLIAAAYREMREELGIGRDEILDDLILVNRYMKTVEYPARLFHDCKYVNLFAQRLTPQGIKSIAPDSDEVERIELLSLTQLEELVRLDRGVAPGLKNSLPVFLEWLASHPSFLNM